MGASRTPLPRLRPPPQDAGSVGMLCPQSHCGWLRNPDESGFSADPGPRSRTPEQTEGLGPSSSSRKTNYLARQPFRRSMPASRAKAEGDRRSDASPLTAPRYLFASGAESLAKEAAAGLAECRQRLEEILARGRPRTIENLLVPYDRLLSGLSELQGQSRFLFDVHPNAAVRETADQWYQEAERFAPDLALNRPLYDAFVDLDVSQEDPETKYAVRKILRDFRLAGVDRDAATRERIKGLRDEITATGQDFDRTIREDERSIQVDGAADLAGLPADFVKAHPPGPDGKITITTKYPDIIPVFRYARDPEVRRRLQWEHLNRGHPANLETLSKLMATRHHLPRGLGHESFADYIVQDKMIGSAKGIVDCVAKVAAASGDRAKEESEILIARERKDVPNATSLQAWDTNFYSELVRAENFDFDAKLLRPYFA